MSNEPVSYPAMKSLSLVLAGLLVAPFAAGAADTNSIEHISECTRANIPEPGAIRAMRFTARDRVGQTRVTRLRLEGKRAPDGSRRLLARFVAPPEMEGSMLLMIERDGENELYFKSPDLPEPKRINGPDQSLNMFGTDFTYEDFQNLQSFNRPGLSKQLLDSKVSGRPVWVVETLPASNSGSGYKSIVTSIDQATCLPLKIEMFGKDGRIRKVLSVDPNQIAKRGSTWIAHHALMKDVRDYTETQLLVESVEVHVEFAEQHFQLSSLDKAGTPSD
jgi:hypothetical protein